MIYSTGKTLMQMTEARGALAVVGVTAQRRRRYRRGKAYRSESLPFGRSVVE